jgi:hypothetical protein
MILHHFQCPYCWEETSLLLDTSVDKLNYIEDCEVCCNPIEIEAVIRNSSLESFNFKSIEQ